MSTEERAKQLLEEVLEEFYSRADWDERSLGQMLDEALKSYNDDIADEVYKQMIDKFSDTFTKTIPTVIPTAVELSSLLYSNSDLLSGETTQILKTALQTNITSSEIAKKLYDGYNSEVDDVLDVINKLPNYITDFMDDGDIAKITEAISKLKTKPLKVAVAEIAKAVEKVSEDALHEALETYLQEKARFYADRIAKTEIQRANVLNNAQNMMEDPDIEFVKWELSSRHRIYDICDLYANLDVGYGKGIYKKGDYPATPLHPFCMCKVVPYYHTPKKKKVKDPYDDFMKNISEDQQRAIAGSWDKLGDYLNGESLIDILNQQRPKYPLTPIKDVLKKIRKN